MVTGLVLCAIYLAVELWVPSLDRWASPAMSTATPVCLLLVIVVVAARRRPRAFEVQPDVPAFSTPPQPAVVFIALGPLFLAAANVGNLIQDWGTEPFLYDQALDLLFAALVPLSIFIVCHDMNVQLRPEGLWQRGITGWLVIPWEASPTVPTLPPPAYANTVQLTYGRPDLIRRNGLHVFRHRLRTADIEPWLITAAIRYYVAHPEHRPAIGTRAEYDRLMSVFLDSQNVGADR